MTRTAIAELTQLEVMLHGQRIGRLASTADGRCAFQYDAAYVQTGQSISPFALPLTAEVFIADMLPFFGGFGVFDDSLPDGWGRLLLDRYLLSQGHNPNALSVVQLLSLVGASGRGALEYVPDFSSFEDGHDFNFEEYRREAEELLQSNSSEGQSLETLYRYGGSSGGARPKAFIEKGNQQWLVKFRNSNDPQDMGRIEYEYSLLAKACGIEMPETCLFEDRYFATCRFDRTPNGKVHTISAAGLLNADYRIPSLDYESLLLACQRLTEDMTEVEKLFRLMVFNVAIGNRDDHAKNFSFQFVGDRWKLSPAYDLLPSAGFNGQHTTSVNGNGNPSTEDLLAVAHTVGVSKDHAYSITESVMNRCRKEKKAKEL
jgi:serine/threonine-protein kinase HipA